MLVLGIATVAQGQVRGYDPGYLELYNQQQQWMYQMQMQQYQQQMQQTLNSGGQGVAIPPPLPVNPPTYLFTNPMPLGQGGQ
jgi:hypothetical protein